MMRMVFTTTRTAGRPQSWADPTSVRVSLLAWMSLVLEVVLVIWYHLPWGLSHKIASIMNSPGTNSWGNGTGIFHWMEIICVSFISKVLVQNNNRKYFGGWKYHSFSKLNIYEQVLVMIKPKPREFTKLWKSTIKVKVFCWKVLFHFFKVDKCLFWGCDGINHLSWYCYFLMTFEWLINFQRGNSGINENWC